tara:strand:- start:90 stop:482 length:393 start_codon:yes stop_codon:yes gene_type:complete
MIKWLADRDIVMGYEIFPYTDQISLLPINDKRFGNNVKFIDIPQWTEQYMVYRSFIGKDFQLVFFRPVDIDTTCEIIIVSFCLYQSKTKTQVYHISENMLTNVNTGNEYFINILPVIIKNNRMTLKENYK